MQISIAEETTILLYLRVVSPPCSKTAQMDTCKLHAFGGWGNLSSQVLNWNVGFCKDTCWYFLGGLAKSLSKSTSIIKHTVPFLKLTANTPENQGLEDHSFPFWGQAYFSGASR